MKWWQKGLVMALSLLERKAMWATISLDRDHHCHKGSNMGSSCKYLLALFPVDVPMLVYLHSCQW
jgi:hypothetical protein